MQKLPNNYGKQEVIPGWFKDRDQNCSAVSEEAQEEQPNMGAQILKDYLAEKEEEGLSVSG